MAKEIDLKEAVEIALKNNPNLESSRAIVLQSEASKLLAISSFLPNIYFETRYMKYRNNGMPVYEGFDWSINFSLNLFSGFSSLNYYREAVSLLDAARAGYNAAKLDVVMSVINAYMGVLKAKELLESARADLEDAETNYKLAKKRYEVGLSPLADLYNAEAKVEDARYNLSLREAEYEKAKIALLVTMGLNIFEDIQVKPIAFIPEVRDIKELVTKAFSRRPEVLYARSEVTAQEYRIKAVKGEYLPSVDFVSSYGESDKSFFPNRKENWNMALSLKIPIFTGFSTTFKLKKERAALLQKESDLRNVELSVSQDVFNKYQDFFSMKKSVVAAEALLKSSTEDLRMMRGRYVNGLVSIVDLTTSQARLSDARAKYITTKYELLRAYYDLIRATGRIPVLEGE
jgi:outer membrane protein TolC